MMFVINADLTFQIKTIYIDWLLDRLNEKTMHIMHYVRRVKKITKCLLGSLTHLTIV